MRNKIIQLLGACYVAFALLMASGSAISAFDSSRDVQESTDSVVKEDNRSDRDCERLSGFEGAGICQGITSEEGTDSGTEEVSHGWIDITKEDKVAKELATLKPNCAIVWTADWCKPCKKMYPVVEQLEKEGYTVHVLNYDKKQALAVHMGVKKLPTTIIWVERKEKARYEGPISVNTIKKTLKKNKKPAYDLW